MTDDELRERHNEVASTHAGGAHFYLDELARREGERRDQRLIELTQAVADGAAAMERLTWGAVILSAAAALFTGISLFE